MRALFRWLGMWRVRRGVFTGRWTEQEISDQRRRAHQEFLRMHEKFE